MSARVWLAVSSYRNDDEVLKLIEQAHASAAALFERILVVDSQGTSRVSKLIQSRNWRDVEYRNYEENLGSGSNLAERLRIAAESGADYVYAMNHDGHIDPDLVRKLLVAAEGRQSLGAVYPIGYFTDVGRYNVTGTRELPLPSKLKKSPPKEPMVAMFWSSSNGALYSLEPARKGVLPWAAMWMGWEDLEYGWHLKDRGYEQIMVTTAVFPDNQEYNQSGVGSVVRKPAWRTYYMSRNLILAVKRRRNRPLYHLVVAFRIALECALAVLVRDQKWKRVSFLLAGARDGYKGVEGMTVGPRVKSEAKESA